MPILRRLLLGGVWVWTGVVSFGLHPISNSLDLLAQVGLTGGAAVAALFGGALLDLLLGVAMLADWRMRDVCRAQIALMAVYTAIISVAMPALWLDPFGPIAKNAAVLSATLALMEERRR